MKWPNVKLFWGTKLPTQKGLFSTMNNSTRSEIKGKLAKYEGGNVVLAREEKSGVAVISFSNPQKKNAWTGAMMAQFSDILSDLEKWSTGKSLLLCSQGNDFCSGADLSMLSDPCILDNAKNMSHLMHDNLARLSHLPLISAVLAQGRAVGGGTELLTACDFLLTTPDFQCSFIHLKMGLITGWGGTTRMVRHIGPAKYLRLMSTCADVTANEAIALGFVTSILTSRNPQEQAINWLKELSQGDTTVVRTLKQAIIYASTLPTEESLKKELELFNSVAGGPSNLKALERKIKRRD